LARSEIQKHNEPYVFAIGQTAREFFERNKTPIDTDFLSAAYNPSAAGAAAITESVLRLYGKKQPANIGEVYVVFTTMEKGSSPEAQMIKLLPLVKEDGEKHKNNGSKQSGYFKEVFYDPSPEKVLDALVPQYMTGLLYSCLIQSSAAEHSSRVLAMSHATSNADEIIEKLNILYHRARQEKITNEMLELIRT